MNSYEKKVEFLANEPLPKVGEEWVLSSSPAYKNIIVKVLEYSDGYGTLLTIHSGWRAKKTEHWLRKQYFMSRYPDRILELKSL